MAKQDSKTQAPPPHPPEVLVVEASAGAGKTFELASRYLRLLLDPSLQAREIPLKNILAITFTNKACLEMKARILLFLKQLALDQFREEKDKENLLSKICVPAEHACEKAYLAMDEIIRRYNYFQVQTIDSFINAILSGCAFKLDLSSDFRIKNDLREYLAYSFDELIEQANEDPAVKAQFHRFLQHYLHLENRRSWFPKNDIIEIMGLLLGSRNSYGLPFAKFGKSIEQIRALRSHIRDMMLELIQDFPEGANGTSWGKFKKDFSDAVEAGAIDDYFNPFSKAQFPAKKDARIPGRANDLWKEIKNSIGQLYEWEAFTRYDPYIDIFQGVEKNFTRACRDDDVMFLAELNAKARDLFIFGSISVPELYYRLATQFRHFLIDEFQDTSVLQWQNVFPMVEEALATGGSLFYVGDKKQAIFRWRGGEVTLMEYLKRQLAAFNVKPRPLTSNFRSQKEIVEFNNAVFSPDNIRSMLGRAGELKSSFAKLGDGDIDEICAIFSNSHQTYKEKYSRGYVEVNSVDIADNEAARDYVRNEMYRRIAELTTRFRPADIAILCRSNDEVERVTSWLLEEKLPVESEKTLNIRENSLVKEIIAFLTFLNSPIDDLAFATFIMGDIFTHASGISNDRIRDFLFSVGSGSRHAARPYLYRTFRNAFPAAWERHVEGFFKTAGFVPLYELVITFLMKFSVLEHFPNAQGFVMKFLEVIKEQEEDNQNIARFLDYFADELPENLFVHVASSDSIRVLTIHKSKGLEFPVVIIPFFEINIRIGAGSDKRSGFVVDAHDEHLGLISLKQDYGKFSSCLAERYRMEYKKALIDELNNLYVASTRPRLELYIFVPARAGRELNIAGVLVPEDKRICGTAGPYPPQKDKQRPDTIRLGISQYKDWIGFLKDEFDDLSSVRDHDRMMRGTVLHAALAGVGNCAGCDPRMAVMHAIDRVRLQFPFFKEWVSAEQTLVRLVESEAARGFFIVPGGDVFTEREMVDTAGNTRRTDRLIVTARQVVIVDYKSSRAAGSFSADQIRSYAAILRSIYPGRQVRGVLVYLDDLSVEEVICSG
ncbi:MAG TPA: UvrD-helicase domain-containing protein [Candidatus Omnitrophota bacterium]|nr:UvrD-helicase domain-containing protein [Candidatus Omnitrophota bacterium]HNQ49833.1 UvrD-helicase domain-containing protein [Candidatus Omnitrophota bacterium]HQO38416.1 UvrD-helicase domain-containing protein [Candidatus Omnitrophota bacterium]HQQ06584.1 UvrD-helicase domain-containing protein [Candidatus Omnitrophota bacterium]